MDAGKIEAVIEAIGQLCSLPGYNQELCEREIGYFEKNKERMRYAEFRGCGLFVGSGVLEAGCRTIIGQRLKTYVDEVAHAVESVFAKWILPNITLSKLCAII